MTVGKADPGLAAAVLGNLDLDRAVELVREVCRIPSVLGDEGELAGFLASVMRESGFGSVECGGAPSGPTPGEVSFGPGPRVVLTGHRPKPESHGWQRAPVLGRPHRRAARPRCLA
jgi:acetylornithine deacetylase/succinyl-diaminopimelate desuccinylase-like protein